MRDLLVAFLVIGSIPFIIRRPYVGILVWAWLAYMNPHRLAFGFAFDFPFSQIIAIVTIGAFLFSSEKKSFAWMPMTVVWLLFVLWMNITTLFALYPEGAWLEWDRMIKIQLFAVLTVLLITDKQRIVALVWVIALSLGFFGIKGGIFSISTGGNYLVFGPMGSFFAENNTLALALIMTLPLFHYLQMNEPRRWLKLTLLACMGLIALSILTSFSRGAFLAGGAMVFFLILRSRHKFRFGLLVICALPLMLSFMPEKWFERMATIQTYSEDGSAMGRINAWYFAANLAADRPIMGGGFRTFTPDLFQRYAPEPDDYHDAHSIYFEVLGEQGFVGLLLFLALGVLVLSTAGSIVKRARGDPELAWAGDLAAMLQVSTIGYAVGGAFLGLAYFDLYYHLIGLTAILHRHVATVLAARATQLEPNTGGAVNAPPGSDPGLPAGGIRQVLR